MQDYGYSSTRAGASTSYTTRNNKNWIRWSAGQDLNDRYPRHDGEKYGAWLRRAFVLPTDRKMLAKLAAARLLRTMPEPMTEDEVSRVLGDFIKITEQDQPVCRVVAGLADLPFRELIERGMVSVAITGNPTGEGIAVRLRAPAVEAFVDPGQTKADLEHWDAHAAETWPQLAARPAPYEEGRIRADVEAWLAGPDDPGERPPEQETSLPF